MSKYSLMFNMCIYIEYGDEETSTFYETSFYIKIISSRAWTLQKTVNMVRFTHNIQVVAEDDENLWYNTEIQGNKFNVWTWK